MIIIKEANLVVLRILVGTVDLRESGIKTKTLGIILAVLLIGCSSTESEGILPSGPTEAVLPSAPLSPTATQDPAATPLTPLESCPPEAAREFLYSTRSLYLEFRDVELFTQTHIGLSLPDDLVSRMEELRSELEKLDPPACGEILFSHLAQYMDESIYVFSNYDSQTLDLNDEFFDILIEVNSNRSLVIKGFFELKEWIDFLTLSQPISG